MSDSMDTNIFYAETIEGIGFKVLFEIIEKNFPNGIVHFNINKNGIFIFMENEDLIIDSSFYAEYMNQFEYSYEEEEFLFGVSILDLGAEATLIEIRKLIKKKDILTLSVNHRQRLLNIKISNGDPFNLPILGIQNYINEIPSGYCDFPINLNKSKLFSSLWNKAKTEDDGVNIQLMKNTMKLSFHDIPSIIIGDNDGAILLYENTFKKELIANIIKISSFGTLRIFYGSENLPLLFSAMVGSESGHIKLYVSKETQIPGSRGDPKYEIYQREPIIYESRISYFNRLLKKTKQKQLKNHSLMNN